MNKVLVVLQNYIYKDINGSFLSASMFAMPETIEILSSSQSLGI